MLFIEICNKMGAYISFFFVFLQCEIQLFKLYQQI